MTDSRATILVVEDELLIRMDVVDHLQFEGYETHEAGTGLEALSLLEERDSIGIVFTDVEMPGDVDGIMLAQEVHRNWPSVGLIVATGQAIIAAEVLPPQTRFLSKPYDPKTLMGAIESLLVQRSQDPGGFRHPQA